VTFSAGRTSQSRVPRPCRAIRYALNPFKPDSRPAMFRRGFFFAVADVLQVFEALRSKTRSQSGFARDKRGDIIASETRAKDLMMSEAKKGFALFGGAAVLALAVTCLGGTASSATTPVASGPSAPAEPPSTTSAPPAPAPTETTEIFEEPHDLGGGAGGGMG
jgi:hypothetical protein